MVANGTRLVIAFAVTISVNNNTLIQSELHWHALLRVLSCFEGNAQPYLSHPGYLTSKGFVLSEIMENSTSFTRNIDIIGNILQAFRNQITQPIWLDGKMGYGVVNISTLILTVNIYRGVRY